MIYDIGTEVGPLSAPGSGVPIVYSASSIDLAPNDGVPALFGTGERLYMQFEVTAAFTVGDSSPIANFGVAISSAATLTTDAHILAMTGGSITGDYVGFDVGDLTLGTLFHLPIPSWEDIMEKDAAAWPETTTSGTLDTFRGLRYMGIVISIPNSNESGPPTFTGGAVKARIIKDHAGTAILSNIYPSRMTVD